ncbi:TolB family protein [Frateuria sp. GZRR33]|uniref:TolB family protein n=1 Tax=Frateuria sp. GZRR33 TaxID=3351535 RepID=UPI003EDC1E63
MYTLDFVSNTRTPLSTFGGDPMYSPDGSKIAFLRGDTLGSNARVYLMRADGSNVHPAPAQTNPDVSITAISDWSFDGTRLLFDQVGNNQWVRMIDLRDRTARNVTNGVADKHAWFHP